MFYKALSILLLGFFSYSTNTYSDPNSLVTAEVPEVKTTSEELYLSLNANNFMLPTRESFVKAIEGFYQLKKEGKIKKEILTLIDFSKSANAERMWVIDLATNTILYQTLVSHGRNTGNEFATKFSNIPESFQSSLGFYATAETYIGKHGFSLRLDGLEKGINDKARERAIVIHGADYVSDRFISQHGRLGRSLGCPALPRELSEEIIKTIQDKSCVFIYYPSENYKTKSQLVS
ncbi:MAG: murein L,D-transpeptidase catalytic domain family protein [Flavobacteriales bacterium]|jgi:hypothetical protein|nr:murein L,D-transpeptidase catalytic domain family protein [Flavobacteriales bacterium]